MEVQVEEALGEAPAEVNLRVLAQIPTQLFLWVGDFSMAPWGLFAI